MAASAPGLRAAEYWVMRVVWDSAKREREVGMLAARREFASNVAAWMRSPVTLAFIGTAVMEPIDSHKDEEDALIDAQKRAAEDGREYRVIMNADLDV